MLIYPIVWPPPPNPVCGGNDGRWAWLQRLPGIGRLLMAVARWRLLQCHCDQILVPIEHAIVVQLQRRDAGIEPIGGTFEDQVLWLISCAIAQEKDIVPPQIYRDDPCELLFWGAVDDLTPSVFSMLMYKVFGIRFEGGICSTLRECSVVDDLIAKCCARLAEMESNST
ncbi:MAG: hypothetical protein ACKV0T_00195 [Planctomycetales bacterium]